MIEFKKYNSIENSFNTEFMEKVVAQVPPDMEWVVQEKVRGTNTSFLCDGQYVKFAKPRYWGTERLKPTIIMDRLRLTRLRQVLKTTSYSFISFNHEQKRNADECRTMRSLIF